MVPFVWSDRKMKSPRTAVESVEPKERGVSGRRPYAPPQIEELGSLAELTRSVAAGIPNEGSAGSIHST